MMKSHNKSKWYEVWRLVWSVSFPFLDSKFSNQVSNHLSTDGVMIAKVTFCVCLNKSSFKECKITFVPSMSLYIFYGTHVQTKRWSACKCCWPSFLINDRNYGRKAKLYFKKHFYTFIFFALKNKNYYHLLF